MHQICLTLTNIYCYMGLLVELINVSVICTFFPFLLHVNVTCGLLHTAVCTSFSMKKFTLFIKSSNILHDNGFSVLSV